MGKRSPDPISTTTYHHHRTSLDPSPSPTSVLERDPRSPKGWRNRDSCGIGLGIVAALNKSTGLDQQQQQKLVVGFHRVSSPPLPICSPTTARKRGCPEGCNAAADGSSDPGLICASPPCCAVGSHAFPVAGFLKFCYLCRKNLDGKDIYMYRGEKAFCSSECRYRQMVADEYQESCGYEAVRPPSVVDVPSSVYGGGRLFYTGIMAA